MPGKYVMVDFPQIVYNSALYLFSKKKLDFKNNNWINSVDFSLKFHPLWVTLYNRTRTAVLHLNFRAGSTFPVPVCTVPSSMDRTNRCSKGDAVRLYASYRLNLLLLQGQICVVSLKLRNLPHYWTGWERSEIEHAPIFKLNVTINVNDSSFI